MMTAVEPSASGLAELYDRFGALAYRLALSITGDPVAAEHVVSEAFAVTWRNGVISSSQFFSSVMRAVRSRAMQQRPARIDRDVTFVGGARTDGGPGSARGQEAAVTAALDALPAAQRSALALAYFGGLGVDAIASELRQPISSVKANLQAALHNVRSALTDRGGVTV